MSAPTCHFCDKTTTVADAWLIVNRAQAFASYRAANPARDEGPMYLSWESIQEAILNPEPNNPPLEGQYVPEWVIACEDAQCPPEEVQLWSYFFRAREAIDDERPHGGWRAHLSGKVWFTHTRGYDERLRELRDAAGRAAPGTGESS